MRRRNAALFALVAFVGCTRDLAVPSVNRLGVVPGFHSLAPRESVQFTGVGGAGGYQFAFAPGGRLSGADATIDPDGLYTAGSVGTAQDVVEVTDAAGAKATATVSVGQRVAISPALTGTVPGGTVFFTASGGKPPYVFSIEASPSGGVIDPDGAYTAGSAGSVLDTIVVRDSLQDPLAQAHALVQVGGQLTLYRSETRAVAPHESVSLIALGGEPNYTYAIETAASGNATVDPASGVYTAGDRPDPDPGTGEVIDVVRVTDSAPAKQSAEIQIRVGPRLQLTLGAAEVHPGETVRLTATGGKPPYTFGFAARVSKLAQPNRDRGGNGGNRSGGTVSPVTGEYVPGSSPGAIDWFQVTDATGAPPDVKPGPAVGGTTLAIGRGAGRCVPADLNGDGSGDAVFLSRIDQGTRVVTAEYLGTPQPVLQTYYTQLRSFPAVYPADLALRARDALVVLGSENNCNGSTCSSTARDILALQPDLAGLLSEQELFGGGDVSWITVLNDPQYQPTTGTPNYTHRVTQNFNMKAGAMLFDPSGQGTAYAYTDGFDADTIPTTTNPFGAPACPAQGPNDRLVMRFVWPPRSDAPQGRPACLLVTGGCPGCGGGTFMNIVAMDVGDYDGDGKTDLAFIASSQNVDFAVTPTARIFIAYGSGGTGSVPASFPTTHSGWPAPSASGEWRFDFRDQNTQTRFMTVHPPAGAGARDALLVRMVDPLGVSRLFLVRDPAVGFSAPFDPGGVGLGSSGVASYPQSAGAGTAYVSYDGSGGQVRSFGITGFLDPTPAFTTMSVAATLPFAVTAACFPDVNSDGVPDLVTASDAGAAAQISLGDGTNSAFPQAGQTFGVRTHLRGIEFPIAVGDLDGDGFVDVAAASGGAGLNVLWGGGGMLARGPEISSAAIGGVAVADFGRGHPSVLYQDRTGGFGIVHGDGAGNFEPAVAVTATTSSGAPVSAFFLILPANLGTSAPGVDLLSFENSATGTFVHAILVQAGRIVDVKSQPIPSLDVNHPIPDQCWPLAIGTAQPAVAAICNFDDVSTPNRDRNAVGVFGAVINNPDGTPDGNPGAPSFGAWRLLTPPAAAPWKIAGLNRSRVALAGTLAAPAAGAPAGTAVFLMKTDQLYAVEVKNNGVPLSPASWTANQVAVASLSVPFDPVFAMVGDLDADAGAVTALHIVAAGDQGILVLARKAGVYEFVQQLSVVQIPLGIGRLAAGSPGDVVGMIGDFTGLGVTTEIVPLLNLQNGTGQLK